MVPATRTTRRSSVIRTLLIVAIVSLAVLPLVADEPTTINDFTSYTYAQFAGPVGSVADFQVSRTFNAPIASLHLFIVGGQADDIGFVGSRLVTSIAGACHG